MNLPILIEKISAVLADFPGISLLYLFGSQLTGQTGPLSDYDFAVLDSSQDLVAAQAQFQHSLSLFLNTERIDVVLLNTSPVELSYHIISTGKLLYQKDTYTRVEFEAQVLGRYGDYLPFLRTYQNLILQGDSHDNRTQRYRETLRRTQRSLGATRSTS